MILERFAKQPSEVKDYDIDYAAWLATSADIVIGATATVSCLTDPADTALSIDSIQATSPVVKLWISGGTDRARYKVTVQVQTVGGRLDESELLFTVKDY